MVVETIVLLLMVINLIVTLVIWGTTSSENRSGTGKKRMDVGILAVSAIITVIEGKYFIIYYGILTFKGTEGICLFLCQL